VEQVAADPFALRAETLNLFVAPIERVALGLPLRWTLHFASDRAVEEEIRRELGAARAIKVTTSRFMTTEPTRKSVVDGSAAVCPRNTSFGGVRWERHRPNAGKAYRMRDLVNSPARKA